MALEAYEAGLCGCGCGWPAEVSQNPDNEGRFYSEPPVRCHARTALALFQEGYDNETTQQPEALLFERPGLR